MTMELFVLAKHWLALHSHSSNWQVKSRNQHNRAISLYLLNILKSSQQGLVSFPKGAGKWKANDLAPTNFSLNDLDLLEKSGNHKENKTLKWPIIVGLKMKKVTPESKTRLICSMLLPIKNIGWSGLCQEMMFHFWDAAEEYLWPQLTTFFFSEAKKWVDLSRLQKLKDSNFNLH